MIREQPLLGIQKALTMIFSLFFAMSRSVEGDTKIKAQENK